MLAAGAKKETLYCAWHNDGFARETLRYIPCGENGLADKNDRSIALAQSIPNRDFAEMMTAVLAKGAPFRFEASGVSMSPFIRGGDIITLVPISGPLRSGAVVAFCQPGNGRLVVHRIVRSANGRFLLRGDNAPQPDGWVPAARIIGQVIRVEHRGRRLSLGLGPERAMIALLSRLGCLHFLVRPVRWLLRPIYREYFS